MRPLFLFVGKSASGKTTVASLLEKKYGYKQVQSYTTRLPRYDGEIGHIFVTKEQFDNLGELAAYTLYDDNEYGTTVNQLDECDIYVIDVPGVETLLKKYNNRPITIIYFDTNVPTRINRMMDRGNSDMFIIARLLQDEEYDWYSDLDHIIWKHNHLPHGTVKEHYINIYTINGNTNLNEVVNQVLYYMKREEDD